MPIDPARKAFMIQTEEGGRMKSLTTEKAYEMESYTYGGYTCTIHRGLNDASATTKVACIKKALKTLLDKNIALPPGLRFYCCGDTSVQNRAFVRDAGWNAISHITLGPTAIAGGRMDAISNSAVPGFVKGDITCIHEIGHALHAHLLGEAFLDVNANGGVNGAPTGANSVQVSGYAGMSKKEYVAETFTGLVLGRAYSASVMNEYAQYGGPVVP